MLDSGSAIFDALLLTYAAHPTNLLNNPCLPLIQSLPAVWDPTIVLPQSEIGETAAFARRRNGVAGFLAILPGPSARTIAVPLSFLGRGEFQAMLIRDRQEDPASVQIDNTTARSEDCLRIELSSGGGFIARFVRN